MSLNADYACTGLVKAGSRPAPASPGAVARKVGNDAPQRSWTWPLIQAASLEQRTCELLLVLSQTLAPCYRPTDSLLHFCLVV